MKTDPTPNTKTTSNEPPAPELLQPKADEGTPEPQASKVAVLKAKAQVHLRRATYRPSHKATFIGLAVVVGILMINAGIIAFIMHGQNVANAKVGSDAVTISPAVLNSLGVSRNPVGDEGTQLTVGPNATFGGTVTIKGDTSIAGQLRLNSKFSATDASLANLQAGKTSVDQLDVNGDGTMTNLNLRKDLTVVGATRLQGPVTISQLLTVNNSLNVAGNLAVGGVISAGGFQANSLVSGSTLTVGGHIITAGSAPSVGPGPATGANGTVSISGNDVSGTVAVNAGTGAGGGVLAYIAFRSQFSSTPHVVITAVGRGVDGIYINRTASGFNISISGALSPGGYAFDYIVMQ